ncbi:MAG: hypothetical protein QXD10_09655 [Metallosphaera sp.]|uniref:hypothetical protein n=1 Tax=Metallosphaera sp. TaxID=2020860 RepID=UPI003165381D
MKSLVIIPSVRNPHVISDYISNAIEHDFNYKNLFFLILTEDFVDKSKYEKELKDYNADGLVMNEKDRGEFLKENDLSEFEGLIPKRSHAETSFGLLYLYLNKEFDYAFLIDDDTRPENAFDFFGQHIKNLNFSGEITEVSSSKGWVNVLYQNFAKFRLYPRGFPYSKMGEEITTKRVKINEGDVWMSQGLWTNVPDLDAIRILMDGDLNGQSKTRLSVSDFTENFVVAKRNFLTICSMNLALRREIVPFFYQFPMDDNPWKIGRFDDIWSGVVAKVILDSLNKYVITGFPLCQHNKAPRSTFKDLISEAPGYESNEYFSESLSTLNLEGNGVFSSARMVANKLINNGRTDFIKFCGFKFMQWIDLIENVESKAKVGKHGNV